MQLGMIGLGRMGANMVRRLLRAGTSAWSTTSHRDAVAALARRRRGRRGVARRRSSQRSRRRARSG